MPRWIEESTRKGVFLHSFYSQKKHKLSQSRIAKLAIRGAQQCPRLKVNTSNDRGIKWPMGLKEYLTQHLEPIASRLMEGKLAKDEFPRTFTGHYL
ncbi:hypothetical protein Tco_1577420 [Tanacetum coccineum]